MSLLNTLTSYKKQDKEKSVPVKPIKSKNKGLTILLYIFSLCSIVFGSSVIKAMPTIELDSFVGIGISIFIVLILLVNEIVKVKTISSLYETFTENKNFYNIFLAIICTLVSTSSIYGIFVNIETNKPISEITIAAADSTSINLQKDLELLESERTNIEPNLKKSELTKADFETLNKLRKKYNKSEEEVELEKELKLKLETLIKTEQTKIDEKIEVKKQELKVHKESLISSSNSKQNQSSVVVFILISIIIIVETGIISISFIQGKQDYIFNKEYQEYEKQIDKLTKEKKETIENHKLTIQFRKYMALLEKLYLLEITKVTKQLILDNSDLGQKETDLVYSLFKNLGILSNGSTNDVRLDVSRDRAIEILDEYYTKQLSDLL